MAGILCRILAPASAVWLGWRAVVILKPPTSFKTSPPKFDKDYTFTVPTLSDPYTFGSLHFRIDVSDKFCYSAAPARPRRCLETTRRSELRVSSSQSAVWVVPNYHSVTSLCSAREGVLIQRSGFLVADQIKVIPNIRIHFSGLE
jgi:hypothetical protein